MAHSGGQAESIWRRSPKSGLSALLLATACAAAPAENLPDLTGPQLVDELMHALEERRPFEGRLAGGTTTEPPWAPCATVEPDLDALLAPPGSQQGGDMLPSPACSELPAPDSPEWRRLFALGPYFNKTPFADDPVLLRARGLWDLLHDDPEGAVLWLEEAVTDHSGLEDATIHAVETDAEETRERARAWNDLAVAYLARAQLHDDARDLALAWEAAETAVALWPEGEAALFNRALLRGYWAVTGQAREAWEELLGRPPGSDPGWRLEARQRWQALDRPTLVQRWIVGEEELKTAATGGDGELLASLASATVAAMPQFSRGYVFNRALPAWGRAEAAGAAQEAETALLLARALGQALVDQGVDTSALDAVVAIEGASDAARRKLAAGHVAFRDGADQETGRGGAACEHYRRSRDLLREGGSPAWQWVEFDVGVSCESFHDVPASSRRFDALRETVDAERHPALVGKVSWMQTMSDYRLGRLEAARQHALETLRISLQVGEADVGETASQLAQAARALGRHEEASQYHLAALRSVQWLGLPESRHNALSAAIEGALRESMEKVAAVLVEEQAAQAEESGDLLQIGSNSFHAARVYSRLGDSDAASALLATAQARVEGMAESERRSRALQDFDFYRGRILVSEDPARASTHLRTVRAAYRRFGDGRRLPETNLLLARAALALGRVADAEAAFERALAAMEAQRAEPLDEGLRISLYETFQGAVDEMIAFHAGPGGDPTRAFAVAERAKGRALLDWVQSGRQDLDADLSGGYPEPVTLEPVARTLPPEVALVQFAVLPEQTLVWLVQDGTWEHHVLPLPAAELRRRVRRVRWQVRDHQDRGGELASLFDDLVRPWLGRIPPGRTLLVVPDRALYRLPFNALWDAESGRYLVERHPLALAASASVLLASLEGSGGSPPARGSLLALGVGDAPGLPPLPWATPEVERVGALYPGARVLTGPQANRRAFFEEAPGHRVLHVTAHADYVDEDPLLSSLALHEGWDDDGDSTGRIYAHEIYAMDLSGVELVVLSACRSTDVEGREGVAGWTRAFLAAGVPRVVASLWRLNDAAGLALTERFHRELRAGSTPAAALQAAQVAMLRGEDGEAPRPVEHWAGVQVFGY